MKLIEKKSDYVSLIRKLFQKLTRILDWLHNDVKLCLLNICPEKILVSQVGDKVEPFFYDLTMISDLSFNVSDSKIDLSKQVFDSIQTEYDTKKFL